MIPRININNVRAREGANKTEQTIASKTTKPPKLPKQAITIHHPSKDKLLHKPPPPIIFLTINKTDVSLRSSLKSHEEQRKSTKEREIVSSEGASRRDSTKISESARRVQQIRGCLHWKTLGRRGAKTQQQNLNG